MLAVNEPSSSLVVVGWIKEQNPTATWVMLGFARLNPTYEKNAFSGVLLVSKTSV